MFHHHQPCKRCSIHWYYCSETLIGPSKYTRIAQWCARRGTLQEELNNVIANEIQKATGSNNVGVYLQATHGCCENRGIGAPSSLTRQLYYVVRLMKTWVQRKSLWITLNYNRSLLVENNSKEKQLRYPRSIL